MATRKCNPNGVSKYPSTHLPPFPYHMPADPNCRGCKDKAVDGKSSSKNVKLHRTKPLAVRTHTPTLKNVPSSSSGLSLLPTGSNAKIGNRFVAFKEGKGTSFGAHLLEKTRPLYADNLDEKLLFKRNTDPGNIVQQKRHSISEPKFIHQLDSEDLMMASPVSKCSTPPVGRKSLFQNQYLASGNRAKQGLQYIVRKNYPQFPLPEDGESKDDQVRKENQDECGRLTHHSKLRGREFGIRLCHAPSMTRELDDLYKEYLIRCGEGNEKSERCRFLHHAPSPYHREPVHSILRDHHVDDGPRGNVRKSVDKRHLVQFDEDVDFETCFHKLKGIVAPIRDMEGRLKLLQETRGPLSSIRPYSKEFPEKYPLHICKSHKEDPIPLLEMKSRSEQEIIEDAKANEDLAKVYFTTEASRILACGQLPSFEKNTNIFKKRRERGPLLPHFFMDRLANEKDLAEKQRAETKLNKIKNEMDAFDKAVTDHSSSTGHSHCNFDPSNVPSEKSLAELKLKMEILKQQKARDIKAAAERYRTRRSYFRQILPNFAQVVSNSLLEQSIKCASRLCGEEVLLAMDFMKAAGHTKQFENRRGSYEEEEVEGQVEENEVLAEEEKKTSKNESMVRDILDVMVDVVVKMQNYKEVIGANAPSSLKREWADDGYSALAKRDLLEGRTDDLQEPTCGKNEEEEEDGQSSGSTSSTSYYGSGSRTDVRTSIGDEAKKKCLVALTSVLKSPNELEPGEPAKKVKVEVTDCLNEDLDTALTYDGLFLPVTESVLSRSSSPSKTDSSHTPTNSLSDSPVESQRDCVIRSAQTSSKMNLQNTVKHYDDEYTGEQEEFLSPQDINSFGNNSGREEAKLALGEVDVQAFDAAGEIDSSSPNARTGGDVAVDEDNESDKTENMSFASDKPISFHLPNNFVSKRAPVLRKKTAFRPKQSMDWDDDDVDDDDSAFSPHTTSEKEYEGQEEEQDDETEKDEEAEDLEAEGDEFTYAQGSEEAGPVGDQLSVLWAPKRNPPCDGVSKKQVLMYEGLKRITYGTHSQSHEKVFFEHRFKELKEFTMAWSKGILKPTKVLTAQERDFLTCGDQLNGKRLPRFDILDPHITRPNFSLRMKRLMKMADQAKLHKQCTSEIELEEDQEQETVTKKAKEKSCKEKIGKKKSYTWKDEIAEYECRRKEREKKELEEQEEDDCAKRLGFDALYDDSIYQMYPYNEADEDMNEDESEGEDKELEDSELESSPKLSLNVISFGSNCSKNSECEGDKLKSTDLLGRFSGIYKASEHEGENYSDFLNEFNDNSPSYEEQDYIYEEE